MIETRAFTCPSCGAGVEPLARTCVHCGAYVATVRCAACYQMNAPDAIHCTGCGRELGLEPIGESDTLRCPDCRRPFEAFRSGAGVLHDCGNCGGQFVDHALLRDLLERREVLGVATTRRAPAPQRADTRVHYVKCPACGDFMIRRNFAGTSGVIVDACAKHGIWFDAGQLPRVLAFVESGGLARARHREEQENAKQREAERVLRSAGAVHFAQEVESYDAIGVAARELLDAVVEALIGR